MCLVSGELSYFTDLQGSQTSANAYRTSPRLSYFTDLQGSQTGKPDVGSYISLVTLLIYKVLKLIVLI